MSRNAKPLKLRNGTYYAQWLEGKKHYRLSLSTGDQLEAVKRFPIVQKTKLSWEKYLKTTELYSDTPVHEIISAANTQFSPAIKFNGSKDGIKSFIEYAVKNGLGSYDEATGEWHIKTPYNGEQSALQGLNAIVDTLQSKNNEKEITTFYLESVQQLYVDKITSKRFADIWLNFLGEKNIKAWDQINENLLLVFKEWRYKTPFPGKKPKIPKTPSVRSKPKTPSVKRDPKLPSAEVVNRHIRFLQKSFRLAVNKGYMSSNPIEFWIPDPHHGKQKQGMDYEELRAFFKDDIWKQDYLMNGKSKVNLGFRFFDFIALLFLSCKRRGEIINLNIEDVNFNSKYVSYLETKNSSKGTKYVIQKAFFISSEIEIILRRVIGNRSDGTLFRIPDVLKRSNKTNGQSDGINGDYISEVMKNCAKKYAPNKAITLHCLRHTATSIMEKAGLTDDEIDSTLGHYNVKTAITFYQDRSKDAVAKRITEKTKKGIAVLSHSISDII
jgi:integrase